MEWRDRSSGSDGAGGPISRLTDGGWCSEISTRARQCRVHLPRPLGGAWLNVPDKANVSCAEQPVTCCSPCTRTIRSRTIIHDGSGADVIRSSVRTSSAYSPPARFPTRPALSARTRQDCNCTDRVEDPVPFSLLKTFSKSPNAAAVVRQRVPFRRNPLGGLQLFVFASDKQRRPPSPLQRSIRRLAGEGLGQRSSTTLRGVAGRRTPF